MLIGGGGGGGGRGGGEGGPRGGRRRKGEEREIYIYKIHGIYEKQNTIYSSSLSIFIAFRV